MNDGYIVMQHPDSSASRLHGNVSNLTRPQILDHFPLRKRSAAFVVLHIIIGEDARKFGGIGRNQSAVTIFKKLRDLLFIRIRHTQKMLIHD
jgi:hypothetical protein